MNKPLTIEQITTIEPGINTILCMARRTKKPTWEKYERFKTNLAPLVGYGAAKKLLRSAETYETVITHLTDALRI